MARYCVTEPVFLKPTGYGSPARFEGGEVIDFDGPPGLAMQPLDQAAREAKARAITADFRSDVFRHTGNLARLARSLGHVDHGSSSAEKRDFIARWIERNLSAAG